MKSNFKPKVGDVVWWKKEDWFLIRVKIVKKVKGEEPVNVVVDDGYSNIEHFAYNSNLFSTPQEAFNAEVK